MLTANTNSDLLIKQAKKFRPNVVVIAEKRKYKIVNDALIGLGIKVYTGEDAIAEMYLLSKCDYLLHNASGFAHVALLLNSEMNHVDSQRPGGNETLKTFMEII